jgi:hypothetical protein
MKIANKLTMNLLVLTLVSSSTVLFAQTTAATFALDIAEKPLEAENTPGTLILLVKYTNVSDKVSRDACMVTPDAYNILIKRDGIAIKMKKSENETENDSEESSTGLRIEVTQRGNPCSISDKAGLNPGQSVKFSLWVSSDYDMTIPGTYEITVTRETDPWNPKKSVTVKSNTLTIIVPEPEPVTPQ